MQHRELKKHCIEFITGQRFESFEPMRTSILACMGSPANGQAIELRARVLEERFSNRRNAERIVGLMR